MPQDMVTGLPAPDALSLAHAERVAASIRGAIQAAGGSIDFSRFMELALYAPGLGYYTAGTRKFGDGGDFVTAPEISPLFSRCLARQVAEIMRHTGISTVLEFGAGSGVMAVDLLQELQALKCVPERYLIIEVSADLRERQQTLIQQRLPLLGGRVSWLEKLPGIAIDAVVLANEVLDAMPARRFRMVSGRAWPLHVVCEGDGFRWCLGPVDPELATAVATLEQQLGRGLSDGYESEICQWPGPWLEALATTIDNGVMLLIDYGYERADYYHPQRSGGTLVCHYRHRVHADPLVYPGLQDITVSLDFDAVTDAARACGWQVLGYTNQNWFLFGCGLDALVGESDPTDARAHLQLTRQVKILTLPGEMGERFRVLGLGKGVDFPLRGFSMRDQRPRLAMSGEQPR